MKKNRWKDFFEQIAERIRFLRLDDDPELDDDIQIEEKSLSSAKAAPEDELRAKLAKRRKNRFWLRILIAVGLVAVIGGFVLYNRLHTFSDYVIAKSYENEIASGTEYVSVGKYIYRYNSDGVSCVSRKNVLNWSITYNMQAPITDTCGDMLVIAEQQGNQVYVVDDEGLVGNFETLLPILKVRVSGKGIVAVVLQEDEVTWVNLYQSDGTSIASDKTTVTDSGYPLDIDLSPDGQKLAVSYLAVDEGIVRSDVVFYHFGTAGQSKENYVVGSFSYQEAVIPEIYFTDNSQAVAVSDNGFLVFRGSDEPEESASVSFEDEILSVFHDDDRIGFLFESTQEDYEYRLELYNYRGKKRTSRDINATYDKVKLENGQILMYNSSECSVFSLSGREQFTSAYEKDIVEMYYFSEYRKYLIITQDSFDKIRIS